MKKHPQADALAARLADAANKPPVTVSIPAAPVTKLTPKLDSEFESAATPPPQAEESKPRKRRKARAVPVRGDDADEDTVPISLRPPRDLLTRYVHAASDRMRETGRAISPQQIMLEVLERGP